MSDSDYSFSTSDGTPVTDTTSSSGATLSSTAEPNAPLSDNTGIEATSDASATQTSASSNQGAEQGTEYSIGFSDDFADNEDLRVMLTQSAQESGLSAESATQFINTITAQFQQGLEEKFVYEDQQLRQQWGKDYESNFAQARGMMERVATMANLSAEEIDTMANPTGYKILHALRMAMGEHGLKGTGSLGVAPMSRAEEAQAMLRDPNHKFYNAIANPADPQWREATEYYNKLVGLQ